MGRHPGAAPGDDLDRTPRRGRRDRGTDRRSGGPARPSLRRSRARSRGRSGQRFRRWASGVVAHATAARGDDAVRSFADRPQAPGAPGSGAFAGADATTSAAPSSAAPTSAACSMRAGRHRSPPTCPTPRPSSCRSTRASRSASWPRSTCKSIPTRSIRRPCEASRSPACRRYRSAEAPCFRGRIALLGIKQRRDADVAPFRTRTRATLRAHFSWPSSAGQRRSGQ